MGSFIGLVYPGSLFILYGVWWTVHILRRYYTSQKVKAPFRPSATYTMSGFPIEPTSKLGFMFIGLVSEIGEEKQVQHSSIYIAYGMTGIVDLFTYFGVNIPKNMDYAVLCLAVVIEGVLFKLDLSGVDALHDLVYSLLLYVLAAASVSVILEMRHTRNVLVALLRPYFFILKGTWFFQIAFILYDPINKPWNTENKHNLKDAGMVFSWHCEAVFVTMLCICCMLSCINNTKDRPRNYVYKELEQQGLLSETGTY